MFKEPLNTIHKLRTLELRCLQETLNRIYMPTGIPKKLHMLTGIPKKLQMLTGIPKKTTMLS